MSVLVIETDKNYDCEDVKKLGSVMEWHFNYNTLIENAVKAEFLDNLIFMEAGLKQELEQLIEKAKGELKHETNNK